MPYLHLPVQSGSDRILKAMNRRHTADDYLRLIERIRAARPDIAMSGDFIVGFPGETDADFEDTHAPDRAVGYAQAYSFKYSPRPGTPGADMDGPGARGGQDRAAAAAAGACSRASSAAFAEACVGKTIDVLIEKPGRMPGQIVGRSPWLQPVIVDAKASAKSATLSTVRIARHRRQQPVRRSACRVTSPRMTGARPLERA